jgi:phosphoglycolate phosphatase|tara:strand:- start:3121 stop:3744 length:624 start_codon:yes stop_codon:yes gene_type:complete
LNRCLIFDFDGTLADTLGEGLKIYNDLARKHGYTVIDPEGVEELRNLDTKRLLSHLGIPRRKVPFHLVAALHRLRERISKLPLIEGVREVLPVLRDRSEHMGILSSNLAENIETFLDAHDLREQFTFISSIGKLRGKARRLRAIARTFSLNPREILYVGDEIRDLQAARRARVEAVAVTWGFNSRESLAREAPAFLVEHPRELLDVV